MSEDLQFRRADFGDSAPARVFCTSCNQDVVQSYYELDGQIICSQCREKRQQALDGWGGGRFMRALAAGIAVGIAGAVVWYAIRLWTNYELAIISIAIGFGVGKAVSWGSSGKGGWLYQLMAIVITYSSIVLNYVPDLAKQFTQDAGAEVPPAILVYVVAFIAAYALPFLMGFENIIGFIIIAVGLWEAWKLNKRVDAAMTGPYSVTPAATPPPVPNV